MIICSFFIHELLLFQMNSYALRGTLMKKHLRLRIWN